MEQPEAYTYDAPPPEPPSIASLIAGLDEAFGFEIDFPNPYGNEVGLPTGRGVASYRAVHALYQTWRMVQIVESKPGRRILEIGAGLARNAYYARRAGIESDVVVDIPMTCAAQAYFLSATLSPAQLQLFSEEAEAPVRIVPPETFFGSDERYDLVLNVDSFPEMGPDVASRYFDEIRKRTSTFLSINHEILPLTIRSLYLNDHACNATRMPYWMRRGYIEEVVRFGEAV